MSSPKASGWSACRSARTRPTPGSATASRSTTCRRAPSSGRPACAVARSSWPSAPTSRSSTSAATSTPASGACASASSTASSSPPPASAGSVARTRSASASTSISSPRPRGRVRWRSRAATSDDDALARAASITNKEALIELTAERAAVAGLDASCDTPVGVCARHSGDLLVLRGYAGLPDGSEHVFERVEGDAEQPVALGEALVERMTERGALELLARAEEMAG